MTNFWMRLTEAPTVFLLDKLYTLFNSNVFFNVQNSIDNEFLNL